MHVVRDSVWNLHRIPRIYAYIPPSKECDVKLDTRLCRAYSLIARRRIDAEILSGKISFKRRKEESGSESWSNREKIHRKKIRRLWRKMVLWILMWKILLKIPIVSKYNFRRIRERCRAVALRYSLFLQVTRWWRVNATANSEKLKMSHVTARNNGNFIRGVARTDKKSCLYVCVSCVPFYRLRFTTNVMHCSMRMKFC